MNDCIMGVKLQELILRKKIEYSQLKGKIIAIDAPNIIFQLFNYAIKSKDGKKSNLIIDRTQRVISHLYGILYRINFYYSKRIFPIFCFDGRDSELKRIITKDQLNDFKERPLIRKITGIPAKDLKFALEEAGFDMDKDIRIGILLSEEAAILAGDEYCIIHAGQRI